MAEPEELIIEGAHLATRVARDAWRRYGPPAPASSVPLTAVRVRLELFLTALFARSMKIVGADPPAPRTWLSRLARGRSPETDDGTPGAGTDGQRLFLPPSLLRDGSDEKTLALYQLLAVQQASRLVRGTPQVFAGIGVAEVRDWFLLAEAVATDRWIARQVPGLGNTLRAVRAHALTQRTGSGACGATPEPIEAQVRSMLAADPAACESDFPENGGPATSLAWAQVQVERRPAPGRYHPITRVGYWGRMLDPSSIKASGGSGWAQTPAVPRPARPRVSEMRRRPRVREAPEDEDDEGAGTWIIRADEPQESVEDPFGLQRPVDHDDDADPEGLADSLADLPEARMVRTPGQAREVLRSGEESHSSGGPASPTLRPDGVMYPEWDCRVSRYRERGAIVREPEAALGDAAWGAAALARHAGLVRRVRGRFERLRPRPARLAGQPDGSEIDIAAYVTAFTDVRAGAAADGRMYIAVRPARRELAVAVLVDVSASTDSWVTTDRRVVDVEKEALLVVCEALDALGDRYGIFAFSGESADDVSVISVKRFDERAGVGIRRRIAALDSDRYTRMGAPIRHLTASLCRERTPRRLLLILSDGKPNDVDLYEGQYGVEDTRQAVAEARRQGVAVFCLTVDREAPRYAGRIFGRGGFAVLHRAEELPAVIIDVLRHLVRA